jgi:hypothetical protein
LRYRRATISVKEKSNLFFLAELVCKFLIAAKFKIGARKQFAPAERLKATRARKSACPEPSLCLSAMLANLRRSFVVHR